MRENITEGTYETLKKLKVINESAFQEIKRLQDKDVNEQSDFNSDYWFDSDMEKRVTHISIYPIPIIG